MSFLDFFVLAVGALVTTADRNHGLQGKKLHRRLSTPWVASPSLESDIWRGENGYIKGHRVANGA
jgi:hypothetical protein